MSTHPNVYIMSGSNRQTRKTDKKNSDYFNTGSFFEDLPFFINELSNRSQKQITLDPYSIADSYSGFSSGTTFSNTQITDVPFDSTKFLILYAQTHKIANQHSKSKIIFHFYDDQLPILNILKNIFEQHPDLLPANLALNLYKYTGEEPICLISIEGKSLIDVRYHQHLIELANILVKEKNLLDNQINLFNPWNNNNLEEFKNFRKENLSKDHSLSKDLSQNNSLQTLSLFSDKQINTPDIIIPTAILGGMQPK